MSPENSHFADVNILGIDFCNVNEVSPWYDYKNQKVKLYFGGGWEPSILGKTGKVTREVVMY